MNAFASALLLSLLFGAGACANTRSTLIFEKTLALPTGRFAGPIEIEVPRRPEGSLRDFEIHTELISACGPLLRLGYPDGEVRSVGDRNDKWQSLLSRRAESGAEPTVAEQTPTLAPTEQAPAAGPSAQPTGHWQRISVESWPGQMEFLRQRDHRCAKQKRFKRTYTTAYDENGRVTLWADIPQELVDAQLTVRIYEITDIDREREVVAKQRRRERKAIARAERRAKQRTVIHERTPPKPRPPMPETKVEKPKPAKAEGATWISGHWYWQAGKGKWVWARGQWGQPSRAPAIIPNTEGPPIPGCRWQEGHWYWLPGPGDWKWVPGRWLAPPPKVENPGTPPVPESQWIAGSWTRHQNSFRWIQGRWGKPSLRAETVPPPPFKGAHWRAGAWLKLKGKWIWSPGFYEQSTKPPPKPKREVAGSPPQAGAIWLGGFWRWDTPRSSYRWVAGHWEIPPGEGYEWIPDPVDPNTGYSTGGSWKLRIDVSVPVEVRR